MRRQSQMPTDTGTSMCPMGSSSISRRPQTLRVAKTPFELLHQIFCAYPKRAPNKSSAMKLAIFLVATAAIRSAVAGNITCFTEGPSFDSFQARQGATLVVNKLCGPNGLFTSTQMTFLLPSFGGSSVLPGRRAWLIYFCTSRLLQERHVKEELRALDATHGRQSPRPRATSLSDDLEDPYGGQERRSRPRGVVEFKGLPRPFLAHYEKLSARRIYQIRANLRGSSRNWPKSTVSNVAPFVVSIQAPNVVGLVVFGTGPGCARSIANQIT
jgi:hypothetical protein